MNSKLLFTGSMVALVTPFKNWKIDEVAFRALVERQIEQGTQVIVPCGTTGESATLSFKEHVHVIEMTVDQVKKRIKVLAGAGANATHEAIHLHRQAMKAGADGTLQVTPYYNKPPQEGLYQHFKAVAASADIPVVLYNVPGRTAVNLLPETVARLSVIDTIVGIKEAAGNLEQVSSLVRLCPKDFVILSGEDALTFEMYQLGARGSISVTANVLPKECALEWDLYSSGNVNGAKTLHEKLMPLHTAMFFETNPIPVKSALSLMGLIDEEYRLPLVPLAKTNKERLRKVLKELAVC